VGRIADISWPKKILAVSSIYIVGLLTVVVASFQISAVGFPGTAALFPVLGTGALLLAGFGSESRGASRLLQIRPLLWIGARSYSLYLWHWPVYLALDGERRLLGIPTVLDRDCPAALIH